MTHTPVRQVSSSIAQMTHTPKPSFFSKMSFAPKLLRKNDETRKTTSANKPIIVKPAHNLPKEELNGKCKGLAKTKNELQEGKKRLLGVIETQKLARMHIKWDSNFRFSNQPLVGYIPVVDRELLGRLAPYALEASDVTLLFCALLDPDCETYKQTRHFPAFVETHARDAINRSPEVFWYYMRMLLHQHSITDWTTIRKDIREFYGPKYVNEDGNLRGSGWGSNINLCLSFAEVETTDAPLLMGEQWTSTRRLVNGYPTVHNGNDTHTLARAAELVSEGFDLPDGYHASHWIGDTPTDINCGHITREPGEANVRRIFHRVACSNPDCNPYCIRSKPSDILTKYDLLGAPIPILADFNVVERLMRVIHPFRRSKGPAGADVIVVNGLIYRERTYQGNHETYVVYVCKNPNCCGSVFVFDDSIAILSAEHNC